MLTAPIVALVLAACDPGSQNDERPTDSGERSPGCALSERRTEVQFPTVDGVL